MRYYDARHDGLTIKLGKSRLTPFKYGNWLGFEMDTKNMMLFVPTFNSKKSIQYYHIVLVAWFKDNMKTLMENKKNKYIFC